MKSTEPESQPVTKMESRVIPAHKIYESHRKNKNVVRHTQLMKSDYLSTKYQANIFLKR